MKRERDEHVVRRVVYQTVCDGCGKTEGPDPDGWLHFSSYHHDWGNDSIESHEWWDVCSFGCYLAIVRRVFADNAGSATITIDDKDVEFVRNMLAATSSVTQS